MRRHIVDEPLPLVVCYEAVRDTPFTADIEWIISKVPRVTKLLADPGVSLTNKIRISA
jgi:hypothetical protein